MKVGWPTREAVVRSSLEPEQQDVNLVDGLLRHHDGWVARASREPDR
jgi:hypothetical protein